MEQAVEGKEVVANALRLRKELICGLGDPGDEFT
jgi:hypothetical protein